MAAWLTVLYYKGIFIASISDAVSSHPVSPGLCTHTKTQKRVKKGNREWGKQAKKRRKRERESPGKKRGRGEGVTQRWCYFRE